MNKVPHSSPVAAGSDSGDLGDGTCFVCLDDIIIVLLGAAFHSRVIMGMLWQHPLAINVMKSPCGAKLSLWCAVSVFFGVQVHEGGEKKKRFLQGKETAC